jgi:hypothetical protein
MPFLGSAAVDRPVSCCHRFSSFSLLGHQCARIAFFSQSLEYSAADRGPYAASLASSRHKPPTCSGRCSGDQNETDSYRWRKQPPLRSAVRSAVRDGKHPLRAMSRASKSRQRPTATADIIATDLHHARQFNAADRWRRKCHPLSSAWHSSATRIGLEKSRSDGRFRGQGSPKIRIRTRRR